MKSLTGSYLKFFPYKNGEKERLIWWPREVVALRRKQIGFLGYQKRSVLGLSFSVSFQRKTINCISAVASALSSENEMLVESEEIEIKNTDSLKTVHVRFNLRKECAFGQQFLIVGDDPILGFWDPSDGVPFIWSDGHVWTAELDVPCGKVIKYKFILKADTKTISWQPGPDRILETWDTEKTITVFEDWDNPESQNIIEEEGLITGASEETLMNTELLVTGAGEEALIHSELIITGASEETLMNTELLIVAENVTKPMQDEGSDVHKQLASTNGRASFAEGDTEDKRKQDLITIVSCRKHEEGIDSEQEFPVLVPGLIPMLTEQTEEQMLIEETREQMLTEETGEPLLDVVEKRNVSNSSIGSDEAEELNVQESKDHRASATVHPTETSEMLIEVKQDLNGKEQQEIWNGDMNWGRRTFKKFLANLGF